ncbi:MAG: DMT family transporter [Lachnospiraceae bacterium]|nr:DMT family transporter [Lachnospiraceae bacterium]
MFYLIGALLCSSLMTLTLRMTKEQKNSQVMLGVNYLVATLFCFLFLKDKSVIPASLGMQKTFCIGIINGGLFVGTLLINQANIRKNGTALAAAFSHLGVLVPVMLSVVFFGETPTGWQWFGVGLSVAAILLINLVPAGGEKVKYPLLLMLLFLVGGCTDMMNKVVGILQLGEYDNLFLFYTFFMAMIICLVWGLVKKVPLEKKEILWGIAMGIFNYFSSWLILRAVLILPSYVVYPVYSVGVIILVNIVSRLYFKEKMSPIQYVCVALICAAQLFL